MSTRDPRHRARRYDGLMRRHTFVRWVVIVARVLAVPTVLMALLVAIDLVLPGTEEEGITYRRTLETRWLMPDGYTLSVGWPHRSGCLERRTEGGRRYLHTHRPGCSASIGVGARFGRDLSGGDTLRVERTPLFEWVREVRRPAEGRRDRTYSLLGIGGVVALGLLPLLSFGKGFAVHPTARGPRRRYIAYVLPVLLAEAVYAALLLQALGG